MCKTNLLVCLWTYALGGFLLRKVWNFKLCMFPSCSHCFTDFRTIFVFALGPFLPMVVVFSALMGISMGKWPKSGHPSAIFGSPQNAPNGSFWMFWAIFLRKGPRAKTKIVLKSVSKVDQLGSMHNLKFQTFLNKNPPYDTISCSIPMGSVFGLFGVM